MLINSIKNGETKQYPLFRSIEILFLAGIFFLLKFKLNEENVYI